MNENERDWIVPRQEVEPLVDELIAFYDELAMNAMNKILNEVRKHNP